MSGGTHVTRLQDELARLSARVAQLEARLAPGAPAQSVTVAQVLAEVSREFAIPVDQLVSPWRDARLVPARHAVMALARRHTTQSFPQIARVLRRDHSTVIAGVEAHARREVEDTQFAARVRAVSERLQGEKNHA